MQFQTALVKARHHNFQYELKDDKFLKNKIFVININNKEWQQYLFGAQKSDAAITFAIKQLNDRGVIREGSYKRFSNVHWSNSILFHRNQVTLPHCLESSWYNRDTCWSCTTAHMIKNSTDITDVILNLENIYWLWLWYWFHHHWRTV